MKQCTAILWFVAGAMLYLSFGYTEMQGSDLWWHLAAGREILQTHSLWLVDEWSFSSAGNTWRNHEWLSDILFYSWSWTFGVKSLVYWKWLVVILTFLVLQRVLYRQSGSHAASLVSAVIAIAVAAPFIDVRPHLYSLLNFSLLLCLLLNRSTSTWILALLFVVWVNLHGGFFFGIMALAILVFPWRNLGPETFRSALGIGIVCVLACLVNPSGVLSFLYPLTYAFDTSSPFRGLGEWLTPFRAGGIQSPYFFWLAVAAPLAALSYLLPAVRRATNVPWEGIFLSCLTLAMALTSRRFIPLFAISSSIVLAPLLGLLFGCLKEQKFSIALGVAALGLSVFRLLPFPLTAGPAYHYLTAEYSYPVDTLDFMQANKLEAKVYALYNWGGYIHWRTDGDLKVFVDGRADTIYGDNTYLDYVAVLTMKPQWISLIEESGADYFLWPLRGYGGRSKVAGLLETGRWKLVYQDSVSVLLARSPRINVAGFKLGPRTPYRELGIAQVSALRGNYPQAIERAARTRREIPYQKVACNLLVDSHRAMGDRSAALEVAADCRRYFPSNMLKR